jgi:hypothetical protein
MDIKVTDRQSFIKFLERLQDDLLHNRDKWENDTLEKFLDAMAAYAQDVQGYYNNTNQQVNADEASWKVFADI